MIRPFPPSIPALPSLKEMSRAPAGRASRPRAARRRVLAVEEMEGRTLLATINEFLLPTAGSRPSGITSGPDGNLWFTEFFGNQIGMIDPTIHAIAEFAIPTANSLPNGITSGPDGNLWFTEFNANRIGRINPATLAVAEFAIPTANSNPIGITSGPDGNLWFTEFDGKKIGRINPATLAIAEFALPTAGSGPVGITSGPDGNLWFTEFNANQIGQVQLNSSIALVKRSNGTNNDTAPGVLVPVGSTVAFTYLVTNPGDLPLSGVAVRDDNGTPTNAADDFNPRFVDGDANGNGLLDATETWTFTASRIATPGPHTNVGTASGTPTPGSGPPVTATDPDNHFGALPALNLVKRTNGTNNDTGTGPSVPVGSTVTFTYTVTNTGNVPIFGVAVVDDNGTAANRADDFNPTFVNGDANGNGLLDTTEAWTFTATRIATPGPHTNVGTATGTPPPGSGPPVTDTDADNHFGINPDVVAPTVSNVQVHRTGIGRKRRVAGLVLTFSEAMNADTARDLGNYTLVVPAKGRRGRPRRIGLASATYDSNALTVLLSFAGKAPKQARVQLTVNGGAPRGPADEAGNVLDGDKDGRAGGNAVLPLTLPKR